ncbi:MAG: hypothetical protein NZO58_06105 [Gemmataceae bacterium]|nr:hypothetical protein [Gemmataceae bacterium]
MLNRGWQATTTWRSFRLAVLLAFLAAGMGGLLYLVETVLLHSRRRFIENPADVMMRAFGLAHFWLGWLFLFTSPRLRSPRAWLRLGMLTLLGGGWCFLAWWLGGMSNPLLLMTFYTYFIVHEICDEAMMFRAYGDAPSNLPEHRRFVRWFLGSVTLTLVTAFALIYAAQGRIQARLERYFDDPQRWFPWLTLALAAACGLGWLQTCRLARAAAIRLGDYAPLLAVYTVIAAVLLGGSAFGSVGFNLLVLIHVMAWLVFVRQRLHDHAAAAAGAPRSLWTRWRYSPSGFVTLHLLAAGGVLLLMALRVYLWQRTGLVSQLLATNNFHYWTIMHITMAYWHR